MIMAFKYLEPVLQLIQDDLVHVTSPKLKGFSNGFFFHDKLLLFLWISI